MSIGVAADMIGLVFYREEDSPHAGAWVVGSAVLGGAATATTLWLASRERSDDR